MKNQTDTCTQNAQIFSKFHKTMAMYQQDLAEEMNESHTEDQGIVLIPSGMPHRLPGCENAPNPRDGFAILGRLV